jgi:hypothetical protein
LWLSTKNSKKEIDDEVLRAQASPIRIGIETSSTTPIRSAVLNRFAIRFLSSLC